MRLLILSDLHIEIWDERASPIDVSTSRPDVVVLAGDMHTKGRGPAWAAGVFPSVPVIYVTGNHEVYGSKLEEVAPQISCGRGNTAKRIPHSAVIDTALDAFVGSPRASPTSCARRCTGDATGLATEYLSRRAAYPKSRILGACFAVGGTAVSTNTTSRVVT